MPHDAFLLNSAGRCRYYAPTRKYHRWLSSSGELVMADNYARLRSDLEIRRETSEPNSSIILKDPIARRFYRFTAIQAAVLESLDGALNPETIARVVSEKHHTPVLASQVEEFAAKLRSLLLLDEPAVWVRLETLRPAKHRFLRNLLSIKIHAFNPDSLLTRMEKKMRFFFGAGFTPLAGILIAAAVAISVLNWESLYFSVSALLNLYSIPLILTVIFALLTMHEFAHGLTLKHFGGKVEEMGFLLLYFIPAFYCNVSDAWLLKKRERILVSLAGGYAQLVIWSLATIAWRLLSPETVASRVCAIVIGFSFIQTLFNFTPLIRLDGYYLLSDYLEIPNLRPKAFAFLKNKLTARLAGTPGTGLPVSGRERRIYVIYGSASFLFTLGLLWVMFSRLGGWMVREFQTWGVVLTAALFFMAVPVAAKPNVVAASRLAAGVAARIKKAPWKLMILALVLASGFLPWELKVSGDFTILPNKRVSISPEVGGTLKAIRTDQGSTVRAGDVLADMENLDLANEFEETRGTLAARQASLALLIAGTRPEEIERARRQVDTKRAELSTVLRVEQERTMLQETVAKKEAELQNARMNFDRSMRLFADGLIARNELERDQTAFEVRRKELEEARGQMKVLDERTDRLHEVKKKELAQAESDLNLLLAGSRREQIEAEAAEVRKLEEKLKILSLQIAQLKIRSTIDGIVATPYLRNRIGQHLGKGDAFCEIVSEGMVIVDMPIPEKEIADVKLGFPITLKVRGYPKSSFEARVKQISPVAEEIGSKRQVIIQGELLNPDGMLKAGMTGVGKILCGKRMIGELVTRRAIRWLRTEFWEYLP